MKQLLLAVAVTLSLAAIPALATTNYVVGTSLTTGSYSQSVTPDDRYEWSTSCPQDPVIIANPGSKHIELLIKVENAHKAPGVAGYTVLGGDPAIVCCNGYSNTVLPGNFFLCKTNHTVIIKDSYSNTVATGSDNGARGYFTAEY